jgi:stage V sporulation protein AD
MQAGDFSRMFFMATGALMSPTSGMQGESIPGVAHGVAIERR